MKKVQIAHHSSSFKSSVTWHTIEAFSYHICLLVHHVLFFVIAPRELYGAIGTIFSCIYLSTTLLHLGIIDTLAIFFVDYSRSQKALSHFLFHQLQYNVYLFMIYILMMYLFSHALLPTIFTPTILVLTIIATFLENLKKITKRLLRLANMIPTVTGTSVTSVILFMALVWIPFYLLNAQLYLPIVLASLCVMSLFECLTNSYYLYRWYKTLPQTSRLVKYNTRILYSRCNILLLDIGKLTMSGNVLVPFFAASKGLHSAALLKFSSSLVHNLIAIIDKVIDRTSIVLFAQTKYQAMRQKTSPIFTLANMYNMILCLLLTGFIWYRSYFVFTVFGSSFILYYVLQLIQKTHIPHTKMLIIKEKPFVVLVITVLQAIITIGLLRTTASQTAILSSLIIASFLQYIILLFTTNQLFNQQNPRFVGALTMLLIIFLLQNIFL